MKTFKNSLVAILGMVLLFMMLIVNVQVGLNNGTNSDITLLGADIDIFESALAQTQPEEEEEEEGGDLRCNDISICKTNRGCGSPGIPAGCELNCEDDGEDPLKCPKDGW